MLGVIFGLREWRCYLEGRPFVIETDHQPNTYLDNAPPSAHSLKRRARWLAESGGYDYTWKYRPGATNVADALSRAPQHLRVCSIRRPKQRTPTVADDSDTEDLNLVDIPQSAGVADSILDQVGSFVVQNLTDRLRVAYAAARKDPQQKQTFSTLTADKKRLYWTANELLWIPQHENLQSDCVEAVHSHPYSSHYGVRRTYHSLSRKFY